MDDDDRAISRIVQQEMLKAGVWIRLHTEDGTMVLSSYVNSGVKSVAFEAPPPAVGMLHFLSIAIDGEEIWRGPAVGLPCTIPEGGSLFLNDVIAFIKEATLMNSLKSLETARKAIEKVKAKAASPSDEDDIIIPPEDG